MNSMAILIGEDFADDVWRDEIAPRLPDFDRCSDGMCGGCVRCAPELFAPVECVDCGRTYPAYEIGSDDRCLDCWIALEEAYKKEKEMAK